MEMLIVFAAVLVVVLIVVSLTAQHGDYRQSERVSPYQTHISQAAEATRTRMREASDSYLDHVRRLTRR